MGSKAIVCWNGRGTQLRDLVGASAKTEYPTSRSPSTCALHKFKVHRLESGELLKSSSAVRTQVSINPKPGAANKFGFCFLLPMFAATAAWRRKHTCCDVQAY